MTELLCTDSPALQAGSLRVAWAGLAQALDELLLPLDQRELKLAGQQELCVFAEFARSATAGGLNELQWPSPGLAGAWHCGYSVSCAADCFNQYSDQSW